MVKRDRPINIPKMFCMNGGCDSCGKDVPLGYNMLWNLNLCIDCYAEHLVKHFKDNHKKSFPTSMSVYSSDMVSGMLKFEEGTAVVFDITFDYIQPKIVLLTAPKDLNRPLTEDEKKELYIQQAPEQKAVKPMYVSVIKLDELGNAEQIAEMNL